jgi:hypothetical protein
LLSGNTPCDPTWSLAIYGDENVKLRPSTLHPVGVRSEPAKRDRYREMLSNPRHRHKFTSILAHFADFDPKYRLPIPGNKLFKDNITRELRKRHCPNVVYAISGHTTLGTAAPKCRE